MVLPTLQEVAGCQWLPPKLTRIVFGGGIDSITRFPYLHDWRVSRPSTVMLQLVFCSHSKSLSYSEHNGPSFDLGQGQNTLLFLKRSENHPVSSFMGCECSFPMCKAAWVSSWPTMGLTISAAVCLLPPYASMGCTGPTLHLGTSPHHPA